MANLDLPQEILLEIFSRLPGKVVGKCRTLSKYWKTHLSTKSFIKKHLITRQQTIQQENLAFTTERREVCIITSLNDDEVVRVVRNSRNIMDDRNFRDDDMWCVVIGSCNGLILIRECFDLILVNPITLKRVIITLPLHIIEDENGDCIVKAVKFGFGYDSFADDYKVVTIRTTFVDVYSVKTRVWKRVDGCYGFALSRYVLEGGVFINGAVHWLILEREAFRVCIAAFGLSNEVFHEIDLPYGLVRQTGNEVLYADFMGFNMRRTQVSVVGRCLMIVDNFGNGNTDIWIMKEYGVAESWERFCIVAENHIWLWIDPTLCYVEGGELLFLTNYCELFACDLERGTVRKVLLCGCTGPFSFIHGLAFVDSLVSPEDAF